MPRTRESRRLPRDLPRRAAFTFLLLQHIFDGYVSKKVLSSQTWEWNLRRMTTIYESSRNARESSAVAWCRIDCHSSPWKSFSITLVRILSQNCISNVSDKTQICEERIQWASVMDIDEVPSAASPWCPIELDRSATKPCRRQMAVLELSTIEYIFVL